MERNAGRTYLTFIISLKIEEKNQRPADTHAEKKSKKKKSKKIKKKQKKTKQNKTNENKNEVEIEDESRFTLAIKTKAVAGTLKSHKSEPQS